MGTTANYAFPYPPGTNAPNVPADLQALAVAVDSSLNTEAGTRSAADSTTASGLASLTSTVNAAGLGRMASLTDTSTATTMTAEVKIAQLTFTASASRRYRVDVCGALTNSGAGYASQFRVRWAAGATVTTSGTEILEVQNSALQFTQYVSGFVELPAGTLPAGTVAIGVFAVQVAAGTGGTTSRSNGAVQPTNLYVEDIGT